MSDKSKLHRDIDNFKQSAENLSQTARLSAVEYINGVADKMQKLTAEKIEKAEEKVIELLDDTRPVLNNNKKQ